MLTGSISRPLAQSQERCAWMAGSAAVPAAPVRQSERGGRDGRAASRGVYLGHLRARRLVAREAPGSNSWCGWKWPGADRDGARGRPGGLVGAPSGTSNATLRESPHIERLNGPIRRAIGDRFRPERDTDLERPPARAGF